MHLVFVTSIVPCGEPSTGYEIANDAIIHALRRAGVRLTILGYVWPGKTPTFPDDTVVLGEIDVTTDRASAAQKAVWLGRAVIGGHTFSSVKVRAAGEAGIRAALDAVGPHDGYVLNAVQMAGAFPEIFASKPFFYVAHNVEWVSATENAASAKDALQRYLFTREARLLRKLEEDFCQRAAHVFTLADADSAALRVGLSPSKFSVLPLVTRETVAYDPAPRDIEYDAALIGTWSWAPNRIGLDWFLEEVTPRLPDSFTTAIAGSTPADVRPAHPGVKLMGRVPDAQEFVRTAAVIPLTSRAGTGVQLKTIETFEQGLPSVATTSSLRGIGQAPGNCAVTDDPEEFAAALVKAAAERAPAIDGRMFHAAQKALLDRRIGEGLARAWRYERQEAAE